MSKSTITYVLILLAVFMVSATPKTPQHESVFSDNHVINDFITEVYVETPPKNFTPTKVVICFGTQSSSGRYYNRVRIGNESLGKNAYVEPISCVYDTYEDAIAAIRKYKGIIYNDGCYIMCDFSKIDNAYSKSVKCVYYDATQLENSPQIKSYLENNSLLPFSKWVKTPCKVGAINGVNTYQCVDQFENPNDVIVYRNGRKVSPENYVLYKQGKVTFTDGKKVRNNNVKFRYKRTVRTYPSYSNDLSSDLGVFNSVSGGNKLSKYSFEDDPVGSPQRVLKIHFEEVDKSSSLARQQFSFDKYKLTHFKDRIKMYVPDEMKTALLSYPGIIEWFSIQGSWGQFGSSTGVINEMYSGSGNSFDIYKLTPDATELYYNIVCRRRHCDPITGKEIYDVLTNEHSSFPVKTDEWITIEREWISGNPGLCKHTIIDSDGVHDFTVEAYNSVCDPENEQERYNGKAKSEQPYNYYQPFIAKIYTSRAVAQHCIDKIGGCYLYFKDYEFLEGENVNAFE